MPPSRCPLGEVTPLYAFDGGGPDVAPTNVKLSELFEPGKHSLVIYNFMFPRDPSDSSPGSAVGQTPGSSWSESRFRSQAARRSIRPRRPI